MLRKLGKTFLGLTLIGVFVGLIVYVYSKITSSDSIDEADCNETNDFDLDSDLEPLAKRAYVPLGPKAAQQQETTNENN